MTEAETIDLALVRGQEHAKRALEVAVAGLHPIAMCGAPGSGKGTLIRAAPGLGPDPTTVLRIDPFARGWRDTIPPRTASGPTELVALETRPCPCGNYLHGPLPCTCRPEVVTRYLRRIYRPLLATLDIYVELPALRARELEDRRRGEPSGSVARRVLRARAVQAARLGEGRTNAMLTLAELREHCTLGEGGAALMRTAVTRLHFTGRDHDAALRVARTIADLDGAGSIGTAHISEAIQYRSGFVGMLQAIPGALGGPAAATA